MATFGDGLKTSIKSVICGALSNSAQFASNFRQIYSPAVIPLRIADGLHGIACGNDPDSYVSPVLPPFSGGQCPTNYNLYFEAEVIADSTGDFISWMPATANNRPGPVGGFRPKPDNNNILQGQFNGVWDDLVQLSLGFQGFSGQIRNFTATRVDGQPDNCGDPDADYLPAGNVSAPDIPVNYDDDSGQPKTRNVDLILKPPYIDDDGNLVIPVDVDGQPYDIYPFDDWGVVPRFGGGESGGGGAGDSFGPETDPNPDDVPEEKPEEKEQPIIGVMINAQPDGTETTTTIFQSSAPNIIFPRLANVSFFYNRDKLTGWGNAIEVRNVDCYVPCPDPLGAQAVKVEFAGGWDGQYKEVLKKPD